MIYGRGDVTEVYHVTAFEDDWYECMTYEFIGSWFVMHDVVRLQHPDLDDGSCKLVETTETYTTLGIQAVTMIRIQKVSQ